VVICQCPYLCGCRSQMRLACKLFLSEGRQHAVVDLRVCPAATKAECDRTTSRWSDHLTVRRAGSLNKKPACLSEKRVGFCTYWCVCVLFILMSHRVTRTFVLLICVLLMPFLSFHSYAVCCVQRRSAAAEQCDRCHLCAFRYCLDPDMRIT
jgi:hypothetical protein